MSAKTHLFYIITIIVLAIAALVGWNTSALKEDALVDLKSSIAFKDATIDSFKNKLNQTVYENNVNMSATDELISAMSEQVFQLKDKDEKRVKEVKELTIQLQKAKLPPITIPYDREKPQKPPEFYTNDSLVHKDSVIIPPRKFRNSTEYYDISGSVLLTGVYLDSVVVSDTNSIRIIEQRPRGIINRLTKSNTTVIQNIHSNPYVKTMGIQNIQVKHKTNNWNKYYKPALFFIAGLLIVK